MSAFKIAAAQVPSVRGDIDANVTTHALAIAKAARHGISVLVFPELSLIGYDPELAAQLAVAADDNRLATLLALACRHSIDVVAGAPLYNPTGRPALGAIVFTASGEIRTYRKMHLGGSEPTYFSPGDAPMTIAVAEHKVGLAICADASKSTHPQSYARAGADVYAAGVFLNAEWYATDAPRLRDHAARFHMLTVMANQADSRGKLESVGRSAVWAPGGELLAQADGVEDALIIAASNNAQWHGEVVKLQ